MFLAHSPLTYETSDKVNIHALTHDAPSRILEPTEEPEEKKPEQKPKKRGWFGKEEPEPPPAPPVHVPSLVFVHERIAYLFLRLCWHTSADSFFGSASPRDQIRLLRELPSQGYAAALSTKRAVNLSAPLCLVFDPRVDHRL